MAVALNIVNTNPPSPITSSFLEKLDPSLDSRDTIQDRCHCCSGDTKRMASTVVAHIGWFGHTPIKLYEGNQHEPRKISQCSCPLEEIVACIFLDREFDSSGYRSVPRAAHEMRSRCPGMQVPGRDIFSSSSLPELCSDKDANIVNVLATLCGCSRLIGPICV